MSIIVEHGWSLLGLVFLGLAIHNVSQVSPPAVAHLSAPEPLSAQPLNGLAAALSGEDEARATRAVYAACRLPAEEALRLAEQAAATAPGLARLVRDCALPPGVAVQELETIIEQDGPLAAVAVLELHRLGVTDSPALQARAAADAGLAGWLAAYSLATR